MKITAAFDLTSDIENQIANLRLLQTRLSELGLNVSVSTKTTPRSPDEMGANERAWLEYSGKSRMNMRDKTLSREEQAVVYLKERGLETFPIVEKTHSDDNVNADASNDVDDDDDTDVFGIRIEEKPSVQSDSSAS